MTTTWLQMRRATASEWVMRTIVTPSSLLILPSRSRTWLVVSVSRALVASSHRSVLGLVMSARAMATRCCWPPESCEGYEPSLPSRPTSARSLRARLGASARETRLPVLASVAGKMTLSSTVRCSNREKRWKIMPMSARSSRRSLPRRLVTSWPSMTTEPLVGCSRRLMQRTSVDLPAPDSPMMPKMSPEPMLSVTSSMAWKGPAGVS